MNISYNWLKQYVDFNLTPDEVAEALTSIGLEPPSTAKVTNRSKSRNPKYAVWNRSA